MGASGAKGPPPGDPKGIAGPGFRIAGPARRPPVVGDPGHVRHSSRIATAGPQGTTMNKYGGKFALIIGLTLLGLASIWPPKDKLKTGIDLSGGTILVYEVNKSGAGTAGNVNLE